jgi:hypothetical protein
MHLTFMSTRGKGVFFLPTDEADNLFSTVGILYNRSLFADLLQKELTNYS